jgi:hypothetical protein
MMAKLRASMASGRIMVMAGVGMVGLFGFDQDSIKHANN